MTEVCLRWDPECPVSQRCGSVDVGASQCRPRINSPGAARYICQKLCTGRPADAPQACMPEGRPETVNRVREQVQAGHDPLEGEDHELVALAYTYLIESDTAFEADVRFRPSGSSFSTKAEYDAWLESHPSKTSGVEDRWRERLNSTNAGNLSMWFGWAGEVELHVFHIDFPPGQVINEFRLRFPDLAARCDAAVNEAQQAANESAVVRMSLAGSLDTITDEWRVREVLNDWRMNKLMTEALPLVGEIAESHCVDLEVFGGQGYET